MNEPTIKNFRIDVTEAEELILEAMPKYPSRSIPLHAAAGCVLREEVCAERDQPPFDRATMDGIAIAATALNQTRRFRLTGVQAAGASQQSLADKKACLEVMTGAIMPAGSDTVVPVERVRTSADGTEIEIDADYNVEPQQFVHHRASDHAAGSSLLKPGAIIRGPEMAILTAGGSPNVLVSIPPSVAIVSTGDELVDVGQPLKEFQIRSSNDRGIEAALELRGFTANTRARLPDDPEHLREAISALHDENDIVILSGGVSMGKYDYVPNILQEIGVEVIFHKILQRPGLPMWFGVSKAGKPVFALPGNPVSTLVCLTRYVLPAISTALGAEQRVQSVALGKDVEFKPDLCWLLPVALQTQDNGTNVALPKPTNTSGDFVGLRGTSGIVELPRGQDKFSAGIAMPFYRW